MFYFVFDRSRSSRVSPLGGFEDKYHAIVIHVFQTGKYGFSNADNAGDKTVDNWEDLGHLMPPDLWRRLKGLQNLFAYKDPSDEEKEAAALKGKKLTDRDFADLSYNTKLAYINMGNRLTKGMIDSLDINLKNQYINLGGLCPLEAIIDNKPLVKRYITIQFERLNKPVNADYLKYMSPEQKDKYYQKYKNEAYITFEHLAEWFPDQFPQYINEMVETLDYLPDWTSKYMDNGQRDLYYKYSPAYKNTEIVSREDKDMVINYYLITNKMTYDSYKELSKHQREAFNNFLKEIVQNGNLKNYPMIMEVLPGEGSGNNFVPGFKVENGHLYLKFDDKWYGENVNLIQESIYEDWDRYLLLKRAGLIK